LSLLALEKDLGKKKMTKISTAALLLCLTILGGVMAACAAPTPTESPIPTQPTSPGTESPVATPSSGGISPAATPAEIPVPEEGKAAIGGALYTFSGHGPIPETVFYLTPALGETNRPPQVLTGPSKEEGDVQGQSGPQGQVTLNSIPPGNYYLAVWAPYAWILAVESADDQTPRLITLDAGQRENLGTIYVAWP
jgi:hypothetical protein